MSIVEKKLAELQLNPKNHEIYGEEEDKELSKIFQNELFNLFFKKGNDLHA